MTAPPKRRWFRFSLRTLFVAITIFGVWLGWQLKIVRERKAVLEAVMKLPKDSFEYVSFEEEETSFKYTYLKFEPFRISYVRTLLGDEPCFSLMLPASFDREWIDRAEKAFPEAALNIINDSGTVHFRDSLYAPAANRRPNIGTLFKTGLIEKSSEREGKQ